MRGAGWRMVVAVCLLGCPCGADIWVVNSTADSGLGTLRWAIDQCNTRSGPDTVAFDGVLHGQEVTIQSQLPTVTDGHTTLDGDIDADGAPDVAIKDTSGSHLSGIVIGADYCTVAGLAIYGFQPVSYGQGQLVLAYANHCTVRSCHLGVNLAGTARVEPDGSLFLDHADDNLIGGPSPSDRNVFAGPSTISVGPCRRNTIVGNHIGVNRQGTAALPGGDQSGIILFGSQGECSQNRIGGPGSERNLFGGVLDGVTLDGSGVWGNTIAGNYFGLARDGGTIVKITDACVQLLHGSHDNIIGGGNLFAGEAPVGIRFMDAGTTNNTVQGNGFGLNATGARQKRLAQGVTITSGAGPQTIGGPTPELGNVFAPEAAPGTGTFGIAFDGAGDGSVVQNNWFGFSAGGQHVSRARFALVVNNVSVRVLDNTIRARKGVYITGASAQPTFQRNAFRGCFQAVYVDPGSTCCLGDLGQPAIGEGLNLFSPTSTWHIINNDARTLKAEGNRFGTRSGAAIDAKIWDQLDAGNLGRVDYDPLQGGEHPTDDSPSLVLTRACARQTAAGAEVRFALTASAAVTVTILSPAGRTIAVAVRGRELAEGAQTVLWSGESTTGLRVPAGRYLVRIEACGGGGAVQRALVDLTLTR